MPIKARGELLEPKDQVNLTIQFKDAAGVPTDTDTFPQVSIVQPSGNISLLPTSAGVTKIATGKYSYIFDVPIAGPFGIYNDVWVGFINGTRIDATFSFAVVHSNMPSATMDGYVHLGDDPGFDYSQVAISNINKLIKMLKRRLNSSGKSQAVDRNGNVMYVDCDIYSIDMLTTFCAMALSDFNQVPYFTHFTFEDSDFIAQFGEILVEGATIYALASQALIEKGREFTISDNGINFNPPSVADMLNTQQGSLLSHYFEKLKMIKASLRPGPKGLGVFGITNGMTPAIKRMQFLRARRVI
jgi:hypothetical protein